MIKKTKLILILFGFFASCIITIQSLSIASQKDFWLDEVWEIQKIIPATQSQFWLNQNIMTPSAAPLYFSLQKLIVTPFLEKEKATGHGFDWKISYRIAPAFILGLCVFLAFLLALPIHPLFATCLPVFVCCYNFALYYGAETRIYGQWLGLSLLFYVASLRCEVWIWFSLAILMSLTCISSLVLIGFSGLVFIFLQRKNKQVLYAVGAGVFISFLISLKYRSTGNSFDFVRLWRYSTWDFFKSEGTRMLEGPKKAFLLLANIIGLISLGLKARKLKFQKLYLSVGLISLSQIAAVLSLYSIQIATGYFFAARHGVFLVAVQAFCGAANILLCYDFSLWASTQVKRHGEMLKYALWALLIFPSFSNWFQWCVKGLPHSINNIASQYKPYCSGPIQLSTETLSLKGDDLTVRSFSEFNEKRHGEECTATSP